MPLKKSPRHVGAVSQERESGTIAYAGAPEASSHVKFTDTEKVVRTRQGRGESSPLPRPLPYPQL